MKININTDIDTYLKENLIKKGKEVTEIRLERMEQ